MPELRSTPDPQQQRLAAVFAAFTALGCTAGALACTRWALASPSWERPETAVTTTLLIVAAMLLARLALACAGATRHLQVATRAAMRETSPAAALGGEPRRQAHTPPPATGQRLGQGRPRTTGFFLAIAAAFIATANTANAATVAGDAPPAVSVSARVDVTTPAPDFVTPSPERQLAPNAEAMSSPPAPTPSTQPERPTVPAQRCEAPEPGWTPGALAPQPAVCRLLTSGVRNTEQPTTHVVVRGQTLWSIAASHLPPDATAHDVADAVTRWLLVNPTLADHPDRLYPGDELQIPGAETLQETK